MSIVFKEHDAELGITSTVHEVGSKTVIKKTYDAQPMLDACANERAFTDGDRWGEFRKVGTIPMAELATMMRQDGTIDNKRAVAWLKANPAFVTFGKFLK
jgi:hypothetical protein